MTTKKGLSTCLWFDHQAEQAARFYTGIFKHSKIGKVSYYGEAGREIHGGKPGTVLTVSFELDGHSFLALNGGPLFKFNEAISLVVNCRTQKEIDYYWKKLTAGGPKRSQQCGWLKDKFGVSWQVVPDIIGDLMTGNQARADRVMAAVLKMKKIDLAKLKRAAAEAR